MKEEIRLVVSPFSLATISKPGISTTSQCYQFPQDKEQCKIKNRKIRFEKSQALYAVKKQAKWNGTNIKTTEPRDH